jgi:hypothetical protein
MPIPQRFKQYGENFSRLRPFTPTIITLLALILTGSTLGAAVSRMEPSDHLRIGNAAGTLTTLIEYSNQRVLVGAGGSRAHAADFVGRATQPWDREVDLLVIPGWDEHHVPGALGLLERRSVLGIAVVGLPDEDPLWTLLERESENQDVPLRYLDRPGQVLLGKDGALILSEVRGDEPGMIVRLETKGRRIDIIDARDAVRAEPPQDTMSVDNRHLVISTRSQHVPSVFSPELTVVPEAFWPGDFEEFSSPYRVSLARNENLTVTLSNESIRVPLDQVEIRGD